MSIIDSIATKAGISPAMAQKGLGVILMGLKKFAPDLHSKVAGYLPESGEAETSYATAASGSSGGAGGGGLMGGLGSIAGKMMGGDAGNAGEMMEMFGKAGFSPAEVKKFAPVALEEMKTKVPPDVVDQVYDRIPGLKAVA